MWLIKLLFSNYQAPHSWGFLFVGLCVDLGMTKTKLKQNIAKINRLLRSANYEDFMISEKRWNKDG